MIERVRVVWSMGVPLCSLFLRSELGHNGVGGCLFGVDIDHTGVWHSMFEVSVALLGFMGCRVFGWDNNCYFDTMGKFARRFFLGKIV